MKALIIWSIVAVVVAWHLSVGFRIMAPRYVRREMDKFTRDFKLLAEKPSEVARARESAVYESVAVALVWEVFALGRILARKVDTWTPLSDLEARQKIAQRDARIAELERELHMGRGA